MGLRIELGTVLEDNRWWLRTEPFRHIRATEVFRQEFYCELVQHFSSLLYSDDGEIRFLRADYGFDAYSLQLQPDNAGPFAVFLSRAWHDMVAKLVEVDATRDIAAGLHHHPPFSRDGTIHNDLNPGWFADQPSRDGMNVSSSQGCDYFSGSGSQPDQAVRETVRGVAVLYYLCNSEWNYQLGGETGLYHAITENVKSPTTAVAPLNNSLLIFECSPFSFHSFMANRTYPRNSFIMWLHRPKTTVCAKWGPEAIVSWPTAK